MYSAQSAERVIDAAYVTAELESAGKTLLALPHKGYTTVCRTGGIDFVREAVEAYGWTESVTRPAAPSGRSIDRMDKALGWISMIPADRYVLRRIIGLRALVSPITDRHVFPWRRLGNTLGCSHEAARLWHTQGIDLIVRSLARIQAFDTL